MNKEPLLNKPTFNWHHFLHHYSRNLSIGLAISFIFLLIGMFGLNFYERTDWIDAYTNAAMIMSGVGPISLPKTNGGKLFMGTYSLFSGMGFLVVIGIVFAPVFRWIFRQVHMDDKGN